MRYSKLPILLLLGCLACTRDEEIIPPPPPPPLPPAPAAKRCAPINANAGSDTYRNVYYDRDIWLNGGYSTQGSEVDLDTLSWKQASGPAPAALGTPGLLRTKVSFTRQGRYEFSLTVSDSCGNTSTDTVAFIVANGPYHSELAAPANPRRRDVYLTWPMSYATLYTPEDVDVTCTQVPYIQVSGPTVADLYSLPEIGAADNLEPGTYLFKRQHCNAQYDTLAVHVREDSVEKNTVTYPSLKKTLPNVLSTPLSYIEKEWYIYLDSWQLFFRDPSGTWWPSGATINGTQYEIKVANSGLSLVASSGSFSTAAGWQLKVRL